MSAGPRQQGSIKSCFRKRSKLAIDTLPMPSGSHRARHPRSKLWGRPDQTDGHFPRTTHDVNSASGIPILRNCRGGGGPLTSLGKSGSCYDMMAVRNVPPNTVCPSEGVSLVKFRPRTWPLQEPRQFRLRRQLSPLVNTQTLRGRERPIALHLCGLLDI